MRTITRTHTAGIAFGLGMLFSPPSVSAEPAAHRTPVLTTSHFAFYSDFDTNLNDAMIAAGVARKRGHAELFHAGNEAACFGKLPQSARSAWERAVDYYAEIISPADWGDPPQHLVRAQLAGFDDELKSDEDRQFVEIARGFRFAAAPAYKACRWAAQDEANRRFIEDLKPRLAAHEPAVARRLEELYQRPFTGLPIPVDVVQTVSWSGANSIVREAGGGHILISIENPASSALEVVFHEASHTLMRRDDPVMKALDAAARAAQFQLPADLWHVVLFYTTGESVRRILDGGGKPEYTPMLYDLFARGSWVAYRNPLETDWRPYLDGKRRLSEAAAGLIAALRKPRDGPGHNGRVP